jgi:putative membrane protein|tara:strand:+ start:1476 stop:1679 length:204 start_codon:yes stop_codon:yes gene_type:complete
MARAPLDREAWLLENVLVFVAALVLLLTYRHLPFSRLSCTLLLLFFTLHAVASHYTYSLVPYDDAAR